MTRTAPHTQFGQTLDVPVITYTGTKRDEPPKDSWVATIWVESNEDMYGILSYGGRTVRAVMREDWLLARERAGR